VSIDCLTAKQRIWLKLPLINVNDKHNENFPSFSFFNREFKPGNHLVDIFPDCFSFHSHLSNIKKHIKHIKNLDEITFRALSDPFSTIIVSDASIKNQVIGSTIIGIREGTLKPILFSFSNLTQVLFCSLNHLSLVLLIEPLYCFEFYSSFIYVFFFFFFSFLLPFLSFYFSFHVVSI